MICQNIQSYLHYDKALLSCHKNGKKLSFPFPDLFTLELMADVIMKIKRSTTNKFCG